MIVFFEESVSFQNFSPFSIDSMMMVQKEHWMGNSPKNPTECREVNPDHKMRFHNIRAHLVMYLNRERWLGCSHVTIPKPLLSTAFQLVISELPTSSTSAGAGICHGFGPASASLASASAFSSFGDSTSRCWTWILGISEISGLSASDSLTSSISLSVFFGSIVLFCRRARFNSSARRLISSCCRCCSSFKLRLTLRAGFARASGFEGGDGEDSWWGGGQKLEGWGWGLQGDLKSGVTNWG